MRRNRRAAHDGLTDAVQAAAMGWIGVDNSRPPSARKKACFGIKRLSNFSSLIASKIRA
jgi:hypothetical protein